MRFISLILILLTASACKTSPLPNIGDNRNIYKIKIVEVSFSQNFKPDAIPQMDGESKEHLVERTSDSLEKTVSEEVKDSLSGDKPAKLEIIIDNMNVASGVGQILAQSQSTIGARVNLVDIKTKEILASTNIMAQQGTQMGGNVGTLVAIVANTASAVKSDRVSAVSKKFAVNTNEWLLRKP